MVLLARYAPLAPRLQRLLVAARDLLLELVDRRLRCRSSRARAVWLNHGSALLPPRPRELATDATRRGRRGRKASGRYRRAPDPHTTGSSARPPEPSTPHPTAPGR